MLRCAATTARAASTFTLPALVLESGDVLHNARLVYQTYGRPGAPCILHPTSFDAKHPELEYAIGPGRALDTDKYFVVVPNMLGGGLSSGPNNHGSPFPPVSVGDNVALQAALLTSLGVQEVALAYGYSMGGMQALHWAALHPSRVRRVVSTCATATCHAYNAVFLEGLLAVLAPLRDDSPAEAVRAQLSAFGRVYAGWGLPAEWYRKELWRAHGGHGSLDEFLASSWEAWTCNADWRTLRAQLRTWRGAALSAEQLRGIRARTVYMPSSGDRYFTILDVEAEAGAVAGSRVVPLSHDWGHRAGDPHRPGQEGDMELIRETVQALLAES